MERVMISIHASTLKPVMTTTEPVTERVQALADILRSALCCHSNETSAPIANPPNSAQLKGTPYHTLQVTLGLCSSVRTCQGTDRHTDSRDQYTCCLSYASREM